jgi:hypothetical protein
LGRAVLTRQMRLKVASTPVRVISSEATSAITPAVVSCPALPEICRR